MDFEEDETIANFCSVTGADDVTARHYLAAADGDVDAAVMLFLEGGPANSSVTTHRDESKKLQEDEKADATEHVRAPIAPRRAVLVEEGLSGSQFSTPIEPFRDARTEAASLGANMNINLNLPFLSGATALGAEDERGRRLAQLFCPPTEIIFNGGMDAARRAAREQQRWLLVTLHNPAEFPCQQMIRDVWREEGVRDFVRESFIFLFLTVGTAEAQRYAQYYPVDRFPHWAILDGRTGKRIKAWTGRVMGAPEVLMELVDFVSEHPPVASFKRESPVAIDLDPSSPSDSDEGEQARGGEENVAKIAKTIVELPPEPTADNPEAVTIQIRCSDGARQRRRFLRSDPVRRIFDAVANVDTSLAGARFDLILGPGTCLAAHQEDPIEKYNLRNATLTVTKIDE